MKRTFSLLFLLQFIAISLLYTQKTGNIAKESYSFQIDGTHLLTKENAEVANFLKVNPEYFKKARSNKTTSWNFVVGNTKTWITVDFSTKDVNGNYSKYLTNTTCQAVGERCYIFVENNMWLTRVTPAAVDSIKAVFERRTPANGTKGIYQIDSETFGNPPDVDNDPKIIIVLLDIKDGYNGSGGYIKGYFNPSNEISGGNLAEMFFIDINPVDVRTAAGLQNVMSTLAHELQHMINWNYHQSYAQPTFVNEGCSLAAEVINGYPIYSQAGYAGETNHYLLDWRSTLSEDVLKDYSRAARFNIYLRDQFGTTIFKNITQSLFSGLDIYRDALKKNGSIFSIENVLQNWFIANNLDDKSINAAWGYTFSGMDKAYGLTYNNNTTTTVERVIEPYAVEYITFKAYNNLVVRFTSNSNVLNIKAIKVGKNKKEVVNVPLNGTFILPEFGTTYSTLTFAIMNSTFLTDQTYRCEATGTSKSVELKWDETETSGFLKRSPSDTICVSFDAIAGGRLDSIKVAARRAGTLTGAVYNFTGNTVPSPLGTRFSEFFTLTSTNTPTIPYSVPYPNWLKMDLISQNIRTDNPFAVAFGIPQDTSKCAYVMISTITSFFSYHSWTYLTDNQTWSYLTNGLGNTYLYLIRAYVSFGNSNTSQSNTFKLEQNYPNPFNPATKIQFSLEKAGNTKLVVYDLMGREVITLLNDYQTTGTHEISFNAANFSSGVYYYKLHNNDMFSVKKMVLMK